MADTTKILIEWTADQRFSVRPEPRVRDGSYCADTFRDWEKAQHFAFQVRRARGWPIHDLTGLDRQAAGSADHR